MAILGSIFKALRSLLCGGKPATDDYKPQAGYPGQQYQQQQQPQPVTYPPQQHTPQGAWQDHRPQYPPAPQKPYHQPAPQKPQHQPVPQKPQHQPQPQKPQHQPTPQRPHYQQPQGSSHPDKENQQPGRKYYDDNAVNQQNPHYRGLRDRANQEGDAMAKAFQDSKTAYTTGDGARAKQLSDQGKEHKRRMEELNQEASAWIFRENNRDSAPNEIDLHGLYVKEAIERTEETIIAAQRRGDPNIHIIVGKGLHSAGSVAKLKPAIEELMVKHRLAAALDPNNSGVLVVTLGGGHAPGHRVDAGEITRRLERDDENCVIS